MRRTCCACANVRPPPARQTPGLRRTERTQTSIPNGFAPFPPRSERLRSRAPREPRRTSHNRRGCLLRPDSRCQAEVRAASNDLAALRLNCSAFKERFRLGGCSPEAVGSSRLPDAAHSSSQIGKGETRISVSMRTSKATPAMSTPTSIAFSRGPCSKTARSASLCGSFCARTGFQTVALRAPDIAGKSSPETSSVRVRSSGRLSSWAPPIPLIAPATQRLPPSLPLAAKPPLGTARNARSAASRRNHIRQERIHLGLISPSAACCLHHTRTSASGHIVTDVADGQAAE